MSRTSNTKDAILNFEKKKLRRISQGAFEIDLADIGSLEPDDIPPVATLEVTGLPQPAHAYSLSLRVVRSSEGDEGELTVYAHVRFIRPLYDPSISSSICLRRLRHIRYGFQALVTSGVLDEGVDQLDRASDGWLCGVIYRKCPTPESRKGLRDVILAAIDAFRQLITADYRLLSVCFGSNDRPFMERLGSSLDEQPFDFWYERREITADTSLAECLDRKLGETSRIVVVISKRSSTSLWLQRELTPALIAKIAERNIPIMCALIDDAAIPPQLEGAPRADFRGSYLQGVAELLQLASRHPFR